VTSRLLVTDFSKRRYKQIPDFNRMGFVVNGTAPQYISIGFLVAPLSVMCCNCNCYISPLERVIVLPVRT